MFRMFEVRMKVFLFTLLASVRLFFFFFKESPQQNLDSLAGEKKCSCEELGETLRWANLDGAGP